MKFNKYSLLFFVPLLVVAVIGFRQFYHRQQTRTLEFLIEEKGVPELSRESQAIIIASVQSILPAQQAKTLNSGSDMIYTDVLLKTSQVLKGDVQESILIRLPGGSVGEGKQKKTLLAEDYPQFNVGSDVLLFLGKGTDGLFSLPKNGYSLYGGFQGKYDLVGDQAMNEKETGRRDELIRNIQASLSS